MNTLNGQYRTYCAVLLRKSGNQKTELGKQQNWGRVSNRRRRATYRLKIKYKNNSKKKKREPVERKDLVLSHGKERGARIQRAVLASSLYVVLASDEEANWVAQSKGPLDPLKSSLSTVFFALRLVSRGKTGPYFIDCPS